MWLSAAATIAGSSDAVSPTGVTAIVVTAITVGGTLLGAALRRRTGETPEPDQVREPARSGVDAGVGATTTALATALADAIADNKRLEALLDRAYRAGFDPDDTVERRPAPGRG